MWDPNNRRAARYARRQARWQARYASRGSFGYRRPRGVLWVILFILFVAFIANHSFWLIILGLVVLAVLGGVFALGRSSAMNNTFFNNQPPQQTPYYQPPQQQTPYYQPSQQAPYGGEQPSYSSYDQGYQPPATESGTPGYQQPTYEQYERPQTQYPNEMPPMQQQ